MNEAQDRAHRAALQAAMGVAVVMVGQLVASQALRDGFFLTHFEATALPVMVMSGAFLSILVVLGSARLVRQVSPARALPIIFLANGILFFAECGLSIVATRLAAVLLYLHVTGLATVVVSSFWSVVNERFDPHAAKRLIGRIGGAATFGGVLGGLALWRGAASLEVWMLLLALGALNLACAAGAARIGGEHVAPPGEGESRGSALTIFRATPYLRSLALLVGLAAFCQAVYDYAFKASAASYFETGAELVSFFALFHLSVGALTFVLQNLLGSRSLAVLGITSTVALLPGSGALIGLLALFFPGLPSAIALRGGVGVVENSLYRSGYELLYTPVLPEVKRPTKILIDVGADRLGMAVGGGLAFIAVGILAGLASPFLIGAGIAASVASLYLTRKLHHGYVSSLVERLRAGTLSAEEIPVADPTIQLALSDTIIDLQRTADASGSPSSAPTQSLPITPDQLRARLQLDAATRESAEGSPADAPRPFVTEPLRALTPAELDPTLLAIAAFRSGDINRVSRALASHDPLPRELIPHAIPLLVSPETRDAVALALGHVAPANTGALLDAALGSRTPLPVRRTLCDLLGRLPTQRSANGLVELLRDEIFELRFRAAGSLLSIHRDNPSIRLPRDFLFGVAQREAASCRRSWRSETALDPRLTETPAIESDRGKRVLQGMTFVGTLLLALLDEEPLRMAILALAAEIPGQRGTGLEYLENVLSPALLTELRPLLEDRRLTGSGLSSRPAILSQIVVEGVLDPVDFTALKAHVDAARARGATGA